MAAHHAVGDEITLPDGTTAIIAYVPESEVWRRPKGAGLTDLFVDTSKGRRLVLSEEWSEA